jgi:hypothetical protein
MERRERLFNSKQKSTVDSNLIDTHVQFVFSKTDSGRVKGELRKLSPEQKMLCALRKVLADMSTGTRGERRYSVAGTKCRVIDRELTPGAKDGEPGSYRFRGRCKMGIAHKSGPPSEKMIEFVVSFRDTEDEMGQPDVEYFDETTIEEIDPRTPL